MAGSEFSLAGDLEMDYYDYNVSNANDVPGSYLGMDPAFCLWIPPFAPGRWDEEEEDDQLLGKSDTEVTELCVLVTPKDREHDTFRTLQTTELGKEEDSGSGSSTPVNVNEEKDTKSEKSFHDCYSMKDIIDQADCVSDVKVKMVEKLVPMSPVKVHRAYRVKEKETGVEKSPSNDSEYYDLLEDEEEIKFADEDEDDINDIVIPQVKSNRSSYYDL